MAEALTPRQARFVEEYLLDQNATQSAIRAGFSPNGAEVTGSQLLRYPKVAEELARRQAMLRAHHAHLTHKIIAELEALSFSDATACLHPDGSLKPLSEWPESLRKCIKRIVTLKDGSLRVEFQEKTKALELLSKMLGLLKEPVLQQENRYSLKIYLTDSPRPTRTGREEHIDMGHMEMFLPPEE